MHTLFLVTTVLASLSFDVEASLPARFEAAPTLTLSGSQGGRSYLLGSKLHDKSADGKITHVLVEWAGGLGGAVAGAFVGVLAVSDNPTVPEVTLLASLWVAGSSAGVTFAGWAMDRRGRFGFTLLGALIGFVVPMTAGVGLALAADCNATFSNCDVLIPTIIGVALLPPIGATIGYELSEPTPWLDLGYASSAPASKPGIVPVLTLAGQGLGVTIGIAGRL